MRLVGGRFSNGWAIVSAALLAAVLLSPARSDAQGWRLEGGWRYVASGQTQLERGEDVFRHGFHLGGGVFAGKPGATGFYAYARADGFAAPGNSGFSNRLIFATHQLRGAQVIWARAATAGVRVDFGCSR